MSIMYCKCKSMQGISIFCTIASSSGWTILQNRILMIISTPKHKQRWLDLLYVLLHDFILDCWESRMLGNNLSWINLLVILWKNMNVTIYIFLGSVKVSEKLKMNIFSCTGMISSFRWMLQTVSKSTDPLIFDNISQLWKKLLLMILWMVKILT